MNTDTILVLDKFLLEPIMMNGMYIKELVVHYIIIICKTQMKD